MLHLRSKPFRYSSSSNNNMLQVIKFILKSYRDMLAHLSHPLSLSTAKTYQV